MTIETYFDKETYAVLISLSHEKGFLYECIREPTLEIAEKKAIRLIKKECEGEPKGFIELSHSPKNDLSSPYSGEYTLEKLNYKDYLERISKETKLPKLENEYILKSWKRERIIQNIFEGAMHESYTRYLLRENGYSAFKVVFQSFEETTEFGKGITPNKFCKRETNLNPEIIPFIENILENKVSNKQTKKMAKNLLKFFKIRLQVDSLSGIPDLLIYKNGKFQFIECKNGGSTLSEKQNATAFELEKQYGIETIEGRGAISMNLGFKKLTGKNKIGFKIPKIIKAIRKIETPAI